MGDPAFAENMVFVPIEPESESDLPKVQIYNSKDLEHIARYNLNKQKKAPWCAICPQARCAVFL